jgi:membrane-associated protease RseP (regulator of RpoE activity)
MQEQTIQEIQSILGPTFQLEARSRQRKSLIFRCGIGQVRDSEISSIIAELLKRGFFPRIYQADQEYLLSVSTIPESTIKSKLWLYILLFFLTILSTMMAGAGLLQKDYFSDFRNILYGWKYSFAILCILTVHEFGHYFAARYHRIKATLPYYLPLPLPGFHFGTLGAFIRLRSPIPDRPALLDVGAAGPIAGFLVSLIFLAVGYYQLPDLQGIIAFVETMHPWDMKEGGINIVLGKSLLFAFFNDVLSDGRLPMNEIYHFPFLFAGWIGLLITSINLIPIGQLDGGHILYALVGKKSRLVGISAFVLLILLNVVLILRYFSFIWVLWIILVFFIIGFRHPPTLDDSLVLSGQRTTAGWFCLFLFILCFLPLPLYIN